MPKLADKIKQKKPIQPPKRKAPLWEGPCSSGPNGGVTQSLLGRWLCCRERFRLMAIEGLKPEPEFNVRLEYGQMWHVCEEAWAKENGESMAKVRIALVDYCKQLAQRYPLQQEQVEHWMNVCRVQFPLYAEWWAKHPDVKQRKPLLQEYTFDVPYELPSGRVVRLRGKWDSVDLIGKGKEAAIYLQENKSKGDIVEQQLVRQLTFDLQTMLYLIALKHRSKDGLFDGLVKGLYPINGVRYNVIRRPLSGGKHSIRKREGRQTKQGLVGAETNAEFYQRLAETIEQAVEPNGDHFFFMRWKVDITDADIAKFERECLIPILEQLCSWHEAIVEYSNPFDSGLHFRMPYGIYNPMLEGRASEVDEYLASGSMVGLTKVDTLFTELQ